MSDLKARDLAKEAIVKQLLNGIIEKTKNQILKWQPLKEFNGDNRKLSEFVQKKIPSHESIGKLVRYKPYFDNVHLDVRSSYFSILEENRKALGYIYLLNYKEPTRYSETQKNYNQYYVIATQDNINSEIFEKNKIDEYQNEIINIINLIEDDKTIASSSLIEYLIK